MSLGEEGERERREVGRKGGRKEEGREEGREKGRREGGRGAGGGGGGMIVCAVIAITHLPPLCRYTISVALDHVTPDLPYIRYTCTDCPSVSLSVCSLV